MTNTRGGLASMPLGKQAEQRLARDLRHRNPETAISMVPTADQAALPVAVIGAPAVADRFGDNRDRLVVMCVSRYTGYGSATRSAL